MSIGDLRLRQLQTLLAVARTGSFTKAAPLVSLTQSAVSRQIKDLEISVGAPLFERLARGVHLTTAGQELVRQAEKILLHAEDAQRLIEEIEGGIAGDLRIGATVTAANYLLPEPLSEFHRAYPRVRLVVRPATGDRLLRRMQQNDIDLAILGRVPQEPDLKLYGTVKDQIVLVSSPSHRLAGREAVSPSELAAEEFVLREPGSDTRRLVTEWVTRNGLALENLMDMW